MGDLGERAIWRNMVYRSRNPNAPNSRYYSELGVTVCAQWLESFSSFITDVGPRPSKSHSLDRFPDRDGNYEPSNCRWATPEQQMWNRRDNHMVTIEGETRCVGEWAKLSGIKERLIRGRLKRGDSGKTLLRAVRPWGKNRA